MTQTEERLYQLLPAIHRIRDAERGGPLRELISVIAEQVAVLEEDLAQLYDDQFIETCAPWVAPYIGDLIGYRPLHGSVPAVGSSRAEVANTIGYRRRKGTAVMLEQLARDVTGWHARVVEFFQRIATTQHMNHIRPGNRSPDLRRWEPLERLDTPFDSLAHTADVRRIAVARGRYNIPNIGIFLWRLESNRLSDAEPFPVDARRYLFSPLGNDIPLFTLPEPKEAFSGLATRMQVPEPISRRTMGEDLGDYYGLGKSVSIKMGGEEIPTERIVVCDLSETESGAWAHQPKHKIAIDPSLGRIAFASEDAAPTEVRVTFHYGFSSEMGGGEYARDASVPVEFTKPDVWQIGVSELASGAGELVESLTDALAAWSAQPPGRVGVISVMDNRSYRANLSIPVLEGSRLLIVAAEWPKAKQPDGTEARVPGSFSASGCRPHVQGSLSVSGSGGPLHLNGLLVEGAMNVSGDALESLSLRHCTLVPGCSLSREGLPTAPREASLVVATLGTRVEISHCITGGVRVAESVVTHISDSIVDATSPCGTAFSAQDGYASGGPLRVENATVIGKVHTTLMELGTNSIFFARLAVHDYWPAPVICERRQSGCLRFSYVPLHSRTPRRYQCQPRNEDEAARVTPQFTSLRYGEPGYAQLSGRCAPEVFGGAHDESEMGAFHELFEPQRITNVRVRLEEYLRFGLEAGLFFEPQLEGQPAPRRDYGYGRFTDLCDDHAANHLPGIGGGLI